MLSELNKNPAQSRKRYGTICARIYSEHEHKLGIDTPGAKAGRKVHLTVQDSTRQPEAMKHAKWVCRHHECAGQHWPTKSALLAAHEDNRILKQKQETHLFLAVAELPAVEAQPEKKDDKGRIVHEAREASPAFAMLLSDED